jgi:hypothetical protein
MRLSRPCYNKAHRCPGWAGGGWKTAKIDRCENGSIRTRGMRIAYEDGRRVVYGEHPREGGWRFGHCTDCDVVTWPYWIRFIDPTNYAMEIRLWWQNRQWERQHLS